MSVKVYVVERRAPSGNWLPVDASPRVRETRLIFCERLRDAVPPEVYRVAVYRRAYRATPPQPKSWEAKP